MEHQANHDILTALPNRHFFYSILHEFIKEDKGLEPLPDVENIGKIKADFDYLLDDFGIGGMLSAGLVQKWLKEIDFKRKNLPLIDIIVGLTERWPAEDQMDNLLNLVTVLANQSPQRKLKGKSPQEMLEKHSHEFGSKGFESSIRRIGGEWPNYANKATGCLKDFKMPKALDYYEKTFKTLLKEESTGRYIFSVFANAGVCYLHFGSEYMARKLLDISLELNQNYAFGKKILKEMDSKKGTEQLALAIRFALKRARTKELKIFWKKAKNFSDAKLRRAYYDISLADHEAMWKNDPAKKYYDFLKQLEIDFSRV